MIKECLKIVSPVTIVEINKIITGNICAPEKTSAVTGCLSSYFYYKTKEEMISSIVISLVKNHYFVDGNKRTALAVFLILCDKNSMKNAVTSSGKLVSIFTQLAASATDATSAAKVLFPAQ